jgi:ppGpp synthetase/RelA/SpoT-type nucleotidyltranferase
MRIASFALLATTTRPVSGFFSIQKFQYSTLRTSIFRTRFSAGDELSGDDFIDASSSTLVLSRKDGDDKYSKLPPWLLRNESSSPKDVETGIEWLKIMMIEHDFLDEDISDIIKAIYLSAAGDVRILVGSVEFCKLILKLEEPGERYNLLVTKDVILASILHYAECVTARQDGIYQKVQNAIGFEEDENRRGEEVIEQNPTEIDDKEIFPQSSISMRRKLSGQPDQIGVEIFSLDSLRLAQEASKIKRAEILSDVLLADTRALSKGGYADISNLLLSVTMDWRALAIRCVASLYRLEGLLWNMPVGTVEFMRRDPAVTLNARYSIRVYANLSQRLGLHRLQSQLEGSAFRILYPRQFSAVSVLFQQKGEAMRAVSRFLSAEITKRINEDYSLVEQLESCEIQARVKTPFSFWKKIVKKRMNGSKGSGILSPASAIHVADVLDGVALRVIIKANTWTAANEEMVDARERMLCYYVHHLIRSQWPATDPSRIKDYIRKPKSNGYESLHHTSIITYNDQKIPFEVQVRSQKMHEFAEFGVAAHWGYKANNKRLLPPSKSSVSAISIENSILDSLETANREPSIGDEEDSSYITALQNAREYILRSNVYVFLAGSIADLEGGHLLSLQAGSQIVDVLSELGRKFKIQTDEINFQVWKNGQLALPNEMVENGDVILFQNLTGIRKEKNERIENLKSAKAS